MCAGHMADFGVIGYRDGLPRLPRHRLIERGFVGVVGGYAMLRVYPIEADESAVIKKFLDRPYCTWPQKREPSAAQNTACHDDRETRTVAQLPSLYSLHS